MLFFFIDKFSSNVSFVCQKRYELSVNNVNSITSTYMNAIKLVDKTVSGNKSFLKIKFDLEVTETKKKLHNIYYIIIYTS